MPFKAMAMSKRERGYLLLLAAAALYPAVILLRWIIGAIPFRYGLDYNEGIVWQQMNDIVAGRGYAPINGFPAIVYHYPPVYHLLSALVAAPGIDPLSAGRIVSLVATIGSTLVIASFVRMWLAEDFSRMPRIAGTAGAVVCYLGCKGVQDWAPLMRVDPTACFFALLGLWLLVRAVRSPRLIYAAALFFVLSVFTKQNSVLTAAAGFGVLAFWRPGIALRGVATCILVGSAALALLIWQTDGEVLRHLILYNINRFDVARFLPNFWFGTSRGDRILLVLGMGGLVRTVLHWRELRGQTELPAEHMVACQATTVFALLATLSLISTAKYGSSSAYYMQWEAALAVFGGVAVARLLALAERWWADGRKGAAIACGSLPLLAMIAVAALTSRANIHQMRHFQEDGDRLSVLIAPIHGPIISEEMVLLLRQHRPVLWEPAIFRELAYAGRWNEQILVDKIRRHEIAAIITEGDRGYRWFDEQFSPAIADAMDEALPYRIHVGIKILHLPQPPAAATGGITRTPTPAGRQTSPRA